MFALLLQDFDAVRIGLVDRMSAGMGAPSLLERASHAQAHEHWPEFLPP